MNLILLLEKVYLLGALMGTVMIHYGFVKYGGVKYAQPYLFILFYIMQLFLWPFYLVYNPITTSRMFNCSVYQAIDMQTSFIVSAVEEELNS